MTDELRLRQMTRTEFDTLVDWAADEGWNPGLHDADIFWATDPEGFIAAEAGGELVGGGSIVSYDGRFGFMGFFIVRPAYRSRGLGRQLWLHRRDLLISRLQQPAMIGMDGVFDMQAFYAGGGFVLSHRDLRFEGVGVPHAPPGTVVDARDIPFERLARYDAAHFPCPREKFLRAWIDQPESRSLAMQVDGSLRGYGVIRRCRRGCKIGPLFAANAEVADTLFRSLGDFAAGEAVFLDTPENNPEALALARRHCLSEVFGCARMYYGRPPDLPPDEIFGVTTFELG